MTSQSVSAISIFIITALCACKKDPEPQAEPELTGGKGGAATLRITPRHHNKPIDTGIVYIKYKAKDAPTAAYDDSAKVVLVSGIPEATFTGLLKGQYYLYGRGYDPAIVNTVKGGIPFEATEEREYTVTVPVTEGD